MPDKFSRNIKEIVKLNKMMLRRRYYGSKLGFVWSIISPLMMMLLYVFVFGFVFKSRAPGAETSLSYVLWFLCGFGPWMVISEGINSETTAVTGNVQLIKSLPIKSELFPVAAAFMGWPILVVSLVIIIILALITGTGITWHILWLLFIIPLLFAFLTSLGFFLSSLCVFMRDITQVIPTLMVVIMFATPIFYTVDQMPAFIRKFTVFNPFYQIVIPFRDIFINHTNPNLLSLLYLIVITAVLWMLGFNFFRRLKGYFESAL